mmetsp:Transcript_23495/g.44643  ORF Transcript_23495/g.44643 Transcript_23495/m.44643 type:complete len:146 (-) Transcript_23495:824-1261(-)
MNASSCHTTEYEPSLFFIVGTEHISFPILDLVLESKIWLLAQESGYSLAYSLLRPVTTQHAPIVYRPLSIIRCTMQKGHWNTQHGMMRRIDNQWNRWHPLFVHRWKRQMSIREKTIRPTILNANEENQTADDNNTNERSSKVSES